MKTKVLSLLYFITGFLFIVLQDQSSFFTALVIKALIIPVLMILFMVNLRTDMIKTHWLVFAALFFSWAGDVILEFSGKNGNLFLAGLFSFLLVHIIYLIVFFKTPGKNVIFSNHIYLLMPVLLYGAGLVSYLYDDLSGMRFPVILYSVVILSMLAGAINRIKKVNRISYLQVLAGAMLFVISDSAIAVNKFNHHFKSSVIVIMATYVTAQFLIVIGYIKQFGKNFE